MSTNKGEFAAREVTLHQPQTIALEVEPERIAPGVVIHPGCRISGESTSIGPGCVIGAEGPVTLVDCQLGRDVRFNGGFAQGAVFLDGVSVGAGAHIRPGTLLEEQASVAHTVGLKQTLLMPYVTLGSLINFCDCLMAGGSGPKDHSEVGSSYIHFNFTAHQDKATASLIGDVPRGVMLDQPPIFLGGQGGLVGPTRIAYGTVLAAGMLCRRDVTTEGLLVFGQTGGRLKETPYNLRQYGDIDRICRNNFSYLGNIHALAAWYAHIRPRLTPDDPYAQACLAGAQRQIAAVARERLAQLEKLAAKIAANPGEHESHRKLLALRPRLAERLALPATFPPPPDELVEALGGSTSTSFTPDTRSGGSKDGSGGAYLETIKALPEAARAAGTAWLQSIVDAVAGGW